MSTAAAPTSELPPSSPLSVTEREELLELRRWKAQQQQQRLHIINPLQPLCHVGLDDELSKPHHSACKEPSAAAAASFSSSTTQNTPLLHTTTPSKASSCCCCCGCLYCGSSQQHNTTTEKEHHHHRMRRSSPSSLEWEELQRSVRQLNEETVLLRAKLTAANVRSTHRLFDITPSTTVQLELRQATRTKKVMVAVTEALRRSVATRLSSPSPPPQPSGGAPCCSSIEVKAPQSNRTNGDPSSKHTTYRAPQNNCSRTSMQGLTCKDSKQPQREKLRSPTEPNQQQLSTGEGGRDYVEMRLPVTAPHIELDWETLEQSLWDHAKLAVAVIASHYRGVL